MCSILGILDIQGDATALRHRALERSRLQRHRGPDWSGIWDSDRAILTHERLAIVDVEHGSQPLLSPDGQQILAVNGEIYNHRQLAAELTEPYDFRTASDCEVILPLYRQDAPEHFLNRLNGIFAFVLWDQAADDFLIARDPIGVMPLYWGRDELGQIWVASEMKALEGVCKTLQDFPPGSFLTRGMAEPRRYYQPAWRDFDVASAQAYDARRLARALEQAVERQLMCDVPYGVLLSGGLDSSLISALAKKYSRGRVETGGTREAWWPRLHSFAIGLQGSPDLAAARTVAEALDTVHHELHFTVQEGLDALPDVIRHIETFDVTTVRASTPMYLMARRIKAMGIKMVLSGEGSDEIFGGYLYFHKAPNARELHEETVRKLDQLHKFDCLRANKSMAAWGVEARVPFLDREFLDVAMAFDPEAKRIRRSNGTDERIEKWALRNAFRGVLPDEVQWRQKEQFSDGVGYSWIDSLKDHAEEMVSDQELASARHRFSVNPPKTREGYLYRTIFEGHFPSEAAARTVPEGDTIACSSPAALAWDESFRQSADPSGRAVKGVHRDSW